MWMKQVLSRENLLRALKQVEKNKGAHGTDAMPVKDLLRHPVEHWDAIRHALEEGAYEPCPVRRVEIPKPNEESGY
jgi:RNA-directed DNA polymerase